MVIILSRDARVIAICPGSLDARPNLGHLGVYARGSMVWPLIGNITSDTYFFNGIKLLYTHVCVLCGEFYLYIFGVIFIA